MDKKWSFYCLAPHLQRLRICGFYPINTNSSKLAFLHTIYRRVIFILMVSYNVQQMLKVYQVRDNADKVMETMFLLLTSTNCCFKQIVLWKKSNKVEQLFDIMKGPIFNQGIKQHEDILLKATHSALRLLRTFNYLSLLTCVGCAVHPVVMFVQGKPADVIIWLPFDANRSPHFYIVVFYVWLQTSWLAFTLSTVDVLIASCLAQCAKQLFILRLSLENIVNISEEDSSKSSSQIFQERFKNILLHYNEIVSYNKSIKNVFGEAIFYQFFISGWILCVTAYRLSSINPASVDFLSMILYMICMLIQIFMYCYYGNEVCYQSEMLLDSAYAMDWLQLQVKQRKSLIIFMERIKRSIKPSTGVIVVLCNATFVSILRSAYSFYAFLKNSN